MCPTNHRIYLFFWRNTQYNITKTTIYPVGASGGLAEDCWVSGGWRETRAPHLHDVIDDRMVEWRDCRLGPYPLVALGRGVGYFVVAIGQNDDGLVGPTHAGPSEGRGQVAGGGTG